MHYDTHLSLLFIEEQQPVCMVHRGARDPTPDLVLRQFSHTAYVPEKVIGKEYFTVSSVPRTNISKMILEQWSVGLKMSRNF